MKVKSFCGFELQTGAIVIGIIAIVVSLYSHEKLLNFYGNSRGFSVRTVPYGSITIREKDMLGMTVREFCVPVTDSPPRCYTFSLFVPLILDSIGSFAVIAFPISIISLSGVLIYGAIRDKSSVMLPWLVIMSISLIGNFVASTAKTISAFVKGDFSIVIVDMLCTYVLVAYFIIVIYSCYQEKHGRTQTKQTYIHPGATPNVIVL